MDRYLLSQRTCLSALATILACCLTAFAGADPKQEPAQDNAPVTVENFGKVNDHINGADSQKVTSIDDWAPSELRRYLICAVIASLPLGR